MPKEAIPDYWLTIRQVMDFEDICRQEVERRMKPGHHKFLISKDRKEIDGKWGRMIDARSMTFAAKQRWKQEAFRDAENPKDEEFTLTASKLQAELFPHTEVDDQIAGLTLPRSERDVVLRRFRLVEQVQNCNWRAEGFPSKSAKKKALAKAAGISARSIDRYRADYNRSGGDLLSLANERRGPLPGTGEALDDDAKTFLRDCRLVRKLNYSDCRSELKKYRAGKQKTPGCRIAVLYKDYSYTTVWRFLHDEVDSLDQAAMEGLDALKAATGHIDRHYNDEYAGDTWCTDEWELDGCFYDESDHSRLINYGRSAPVAYLLSFIDERTSFVMDWAVTIRLEDSVLDVAERMLSKFWLPLRLVSDRAGRFRRLSGRHMIVASSGELIEKLSGPLGKLGVRPRGSEEKNPRANRLERLHRIYADLARRDFGPSWRGANVKERKLTGIDETVLRHKEQHCKHGTLPPQLLSIQQVGQLVAKWVDEINMAPTKAKGCVGMTRLAAFRQFQPSAAEIERRKLSPVLIDLAFAEECERLIQTGGIIEWSDGKRYSDPELILIQGQRRQVTRSRHDHGQVTVLRSAKGQDVIVAKQRVQVGVFDHEQLASAMQSQNRNRNLATQMVSAPQTPQEATPQADRKPTDFPEISGAEYLMSKGHLRKLPGPQAEMVEEEIVEAAPLPSLYDFGECKAEEF